MWPDIKYDMKKAKERIRQRNIREYQDKFFKNLNKRIKKKNKK